MKKEVAYALSPTIAKEMASRWKDPCAAMFNALASQYPSELLNLIKANVLAVPDLTFAAEIAGKIEDSIAVQFTLAPLLEHESSLVREGTIYGLSHHFSNLGGSVLLKLRAMAKYDLSLGVRAAAQDIFLDS